MKKMIVPYDETKPEKKINDFVYPEIFSGKPMFVGIKSAKKWSLGMIVFTGTDVTANDIFAKIVDSGKKIDSVDNLFNDLQKYITQIESFSVGNIISIEQDSSARFVLKKISNSPRIVAKPNIP